MKTSFMHYLSSVYFINQPLHVSAIFVANPANRQSTKKHNTYRCCIYTIHLLIMGYEYIRNV